MFFMKKLNKLQINSEKLMKDEELLTLRGGDGPCCVCLQPGSDKVMGYMAASNQQECHDACYTCGWIGTYGPWTYC